MSPVTEALVNSDLYRRWCLEREFLSLPQPEQDGFFYPREIRCLLPYLRVYWRGTRPYWESTTWQALGKGYWRFFRADQVLEWLSMQHPAEFEKDAFIVATRRALRQWQVPVDDVIAGKRHLLNHRVESICVWEREIELDARSSRGQIHSPVDPEVQGSLSPEPCKASEEEVVAGAGGSTTFLCWSRRAGRLTVFPMEMRCAVEGLDPVHTPESARAGLTWYLCEGWEIDDAGCLSRTGAGPGGVCGPSTARIPYRLNDAPRRLMLGASLQAHSVAVVGGSSPDDPSTGGKTISPCHDIASGHLLRVRFAARGGWTHEDAIVVSQTAAERFRRTDLSKFRIRVPTIASRVEWVKAGKTANAGDRLVRAYIDLYAVTSFRPDEAESAGAKEGWLEIDVPGAVIRNDVEVVSVRRVYRRSMYANLVLEFDLRIAGRYGAPLGVGDKVATPHGIKGVISSVWPDDRMPRALGQPAEILISPISVVRRSAMGQLREAIARSPANEVSWTANGFPQDGLIFVTRQPHDAATRWRARGPEPPRIKSRDTTETHCEVPRLVSGGPVRGQRYGQMEFWALMSHGVPAISNELLSLKRSTAAWMHYEKRAIDEEEENVRHQVLATAAMNRFLALVGGRVTGGKLGAVRPVRRKGGALVITVGAAGFEDLLQDDSDQKRGRSFDRDVHSLLEDERKFLSKPSKWAIKLPHPTYFDWTVSWSKKGSKSKKVVVRLDIHAVPVLPPWLRPKIGRRRSKLTEEYLKLYGVVRRRASDEICDRAVRSCVREVLKALCGPTGFVCREILGRRLTRSARAVIVPDPGLHIDEIGISESIAETLFDGLGPLSRQVVLVNRNPTLHRRGILALRPKFEGRTEPVIALSPGVLKVLAADFDGDQASVVALQSEQAIGEAMDRMMPGCRFMRCDPFRPGQPALPLLKELRLPEREQRLAMRKDGGQDEWCVAYQDMLAEQYAELAGANDGWESPEVTEKLVEEETLSYWNAEASTEYETEWVAKSREEMQIIYDSVLAKGRVGGRLRHEIYKRAWRTDGFRDAIDALQSTMEPYVQLSLSTKKGGGLKATGFSARKFFVDPSAAQGEVTKLDPSLDAGLVARAIGPPKQPEGLLAWLANPTPETLLLTIVSQCLTNPAQARNGAEDATALRNTAPDLTEGSESPPGGRASRDSVPHVDAESSGDAPFASSDPRVGWFLS